MRDTSMVWLWTPEAFQRQIEHQTSSNLVTLVRQHSACKNKLQNQTSLHVYIESSWIIQGSSEFKETRILHAKSKSASVLHPIEHPGRLLPALHGTKRLHLAVIWTYNPIRLWLHHGLKPTKANTFVMRQDLPKPSVPGLLVPGLQPHRSYPPLLSSWPLGYSIQFGWGMALLALWDALLEAHRC